MFDIDTVLRCLVENVGWTYVEWWSPTTNDTLECTNLHSEKDSIDEFVSVTTSIRFGEGEGLPGRVWESGEAEVVHDLQNVSPQHYLRKASVNAAGLAAGYAVPIDGRSAVCGILVCYTVNEDHRFDVLVRGTEAFACILSSYNLPDDPSSIIDELTRQRENLQLTEQLAKAGGWLYDIERNELEFTPGAKKLFGISADAELELEESYVFYHPDDRERLIETFERCRDTGTPYEIEVRIDPPHGETRWILERGERAVERGRNVVRGAFYEISQLKERERELSLKERRYRTLAENLPNGAVLLFDHDLRYQLAHGQGLETVGPPPSEYVGAHVTEVFSEPYASELVDIYEDTLRGRPDSFTMSFEDRVFQVETAPIHDEDGSVWGGMVLTQDVTDLQRSKDAFGMINDLARDIFMDKTDTEIAQRAASSALELFCAGGVAVYMYDETQEALSPVAHEGDLIKTIDLPTFGPGEGIAWNVFASGTPQQFDDVRTSSIVYNPGTAVRSEILVPLDDHGVLIIGDQRVGAFDEIDMKSATVFALTVSAAFDRAHQTQTLHEHRAKLKRKSAQLHQVNQLNEELRTLMQTLVNAQSSERVFEAACSSISKVEGLDTVWISSLQEENVLRSLAFDGASSHLIDTLPDAYSNDQIIPPVEAIKEKAPVVEENLAQSPLSSAWHTPLLTEGIRSLLCTPLVHGDVVFGVLTVCSREPGIFDDMMGEVLIEVGQLIGYACNALNQRHALVNDDRLQMSFDIHGLEGNIRNLADRLDRIIHLEGVVDRGDNTHLVYFWADDISREKLDDVLRADDAFINFDYVTTGNSNLIEATLKGECEITKISNLGANIRSVTVEDDRCSINALISREAGVMKFLQRIETLDSNIHVTITHDAPYHPPPVFDLGETDMTQRQADILKAAYLNGYFDEPRRRTGKEIADALKISQPSFSKQLRAAQRHVYARLFGS